MNVTKNCKTPASIPIIQGEDRESEPSENSVMDFETIDEKALPMLMENYEEKDIPQLLTNSISVDPNIISNQQEPTVNVSINEPVRASIVQPTTALSMASLEANTKRDIEPISDSSTLYGSSVLSIGEKIVEPIKISSSLQSNEGTLEWVTQSESVVASLHLATGSYQLSIENIISESTMPVIKNQPAIISSEASIRPEPNQGSEITSELSTLDGPSGRLIGEETPMVKPTLVLSSH